MFKTNMFYTLGISQKTEFEDNEYAALLTQYPEVNNLWVLHKEWDVAKTAYEGKQSQLSNAQASNAALPDNSADITELNSYISEIDTALADSGTGLVDKIKFRELKANYEAQVAELETAQTPQDTTALTAEVATSASTAAEKLSALNTLANAMGLGDYE